MGKVELLTLSSIISVFSPSGLYLVGYSWLLGMSIWNTFFGGIIAFRTLPRQQFGALQHRIFPAYFLISIGLSSGLLTMWTFSHPNVVTHIWRPNVADVAQAYAIASVLLSQGANYFVVGPLTSKTMFERQRLEKEEVKIERATAVVSDKMKALNSRFGALHGISSLLNLSSVILLTFHGLWIGNAGVKGY